MDSEAQRSSDAESRRITLSKLADYLESQQDVVTEQWLLAVRRDPNIATADRLTHQQLVDHLPAIYHECCQFLRWRDTTALVDDATADAKEHGEFRWQNGYRIDELIRELEAFRRILAAAVLRFADVDARFAGTIERQASVLVHQFLGEVTVNSVKQFVIEQQAVVGSYTEKMQVANLELAQMNSTLEQALSERQRLTAVVAHELRNLLQGLTMVGRVWDEQPSAERPGAERPSAEQGRVFVQNQVRELEHLLLQLLQHSSMVENNEVVTGQVELATLHAQLMWHYLPVAEKKGLTLHGDSSTAPLQVVGDVTKLRMVVENLLSNAIKYTPSGEVVLTFAAYDAGRWIMCISDTGPGLNAAALEQLFGTVGAAPQGLPRPGIGLAITRDLITSLGGSLQVKTQAAAGTTIEVILPCGTGAPRGTQ